MIRSLLRPALIAMALAAGPAAAANYGFSLGGFSGGGSLSGSFSGSDLDGNGLISTLDPDSEVTAFSLSFGGDTQVGAFNAGLAELLVLAYRPAAGPTLGDGADEGLWVEVGSISLVAGIGAYGEAGAYVADLSKDAASTARLPIGVVPEPATVALWLAGLALVGARGLSRRRRG